MKYTKIKINTDGGSRGNPGPSAIGVYARTPDQEDIFEISEYIGETTNNVAEYTAVIRAFETLIQKQLDSEEINFVLDSELIVNQILGKYKIKQPHLIELYGKIVKLVKEFKKDKQTKITFCHVLRAENKEADSLVNQALDSR